ncbi:MAG: transcription termination/antitermination protein NusG [Clostridia bacterium]|nr:transcription termination/antitermination protein NusG [Clostridia bacterium]
MAGISRWYVIHTYSGYENKVKDNIEKVVANRGMEDQILEVKVPTEIVTEIKENGETKEVERKLMPGYVLVKLAVMEVKDELTMSDDAWYVIRNTRGCTGFVGPESKPVPLTEAEVLALGVEKRVVEVNYNVGDLVNIIDGPLADYSGVVEELDVDKNFVLVRISMFGREIPTEFELAQVELAVEN